MDIKVTYAAIVTASVLGIFGIKQWSDNVSLRTQVTMLQKTADACQDRQKEGAAVQQGLRTLFSGKVSPNVEQP